MSTISHLKGRFQLLDIQKISRESIEETKDVIVDLNLEQLHKGYRSDGTRLPNYKNSAYAEFKHQKNPLPGFGIPDLKLTGAFYQGWKIELSGEKITITSTDEKTDKLFNRFASKQANIFGLSLPYKREYLNESLRKTFIKNIKSQL